MLNPHGISRKPSSSRQMHRCGRVASTPILAATAPQHTSSSATWARLRGREWTSSVASRFCAYIYIRDAWPRAHATLANATTPSTIPLTPRSGSPQRPRRLLPPTEPGCGSTRSRTNLVSCIDSISRHAAMRPFVLDKIHIRYISGQEVRSFIIMIMMNSPYRFLVWGPIKSLCIYS